MNATEWIASRRELLDAATEGPWFQDADDPGNVRAGQRSDGDGYWSLFASETGHDAAAKPSDAALVVDVRTSLPRALDALDAVLEEVDAMEQIASDHLVMGPTARSALLLAVRGIRSKVEAALTQPDAVSAWDAGRQRRTNRKDQP